MQHRTRPIAGMECCRKYAENQPGYIQPTLHRIVVYAGDQYCSKRLAAHFMAQGTGAGGKRELSQAADLSAQQLVQVGAQVAAVGLVVLEEAAVHGNGGGLHERAGAIPPYLLQQPRQARCHQRGAAPRHQIAHLLHLQQRASPLYRRQVASSNAMLQHNKKLPPSEQGQGPLSPPASFGHQPDLKAMEQAR